MRKLLFPDMETAPNITLTDKGSCFETVWEDGTSLDQNEYDLSSLEFICEDLPAGEMTDYAVSDLGCPVVSARLKRFLDDAGIDNLQYFPVTILETSESAPKLDYFAVNVLGLVTCIDTNESEFKGRIVDGEVKGIRRISKLVLKEELPEHLNIYRVRLFRRLIIISEKLVQLLSNESFTGIKLVAPERWDGFAGEK